MTFDRTTGSRALAAAGQRARYAEERANAILTQSAGLVAPHPVSDALMDEFPFFGWLLRAQAYVRFGYDPDRVFSEVRDDYGFARGHQCRVVEVTG